MRMSAILTKLPPPDDRVPVMLCPRCPPGQAGAPSCRERILSLERELRAQEEVSVSGEVGSQSCVAEEEAGQGGVPHRGSADCQSEQGILLSIKYFGRLLHGGGWTRVVERNG